MPTLLPRARRASRAAVLVALGTTAASGRLVPAATGARAQQGLVLVALAAGMPHGAADTELLRVTAAGSRGRHAALVVGYAALAGLATVFVRRGGAGAGRAVLVASALHFAEGELACWGQAPAGAPAARRALRAVVAATTTVALPAAVAAAGRAPAQVGVTGVAGAAPDLTASARTGLSLLADPDAPAGARTALRALAATAALGTLALATSGDREAAADSALLTALDLATPPSLAFAAYFGTWHALRHTARVADVLVGLGELPEQPGVARAALVLGRRSAWAAGVGLVGAAALAAKDPAHAGDHALGAVLGLTAPHMATVATALTRRH